MLFIVFLQLTKAVVIRSHALAPQFIEKVSYIFRSTWREVDWDGMVCINEYGFFSV